MKAVGQSIDQCVHLTYKGAVVGYNFAIDLPAFS